MKTNKIKNLPRILQKYGVAILEDYFDIEYADNIFNDTKQWMIDLDIGLTNDISSWKAQNLPMGPRYGMYQSIISNCPSFWKLREDLYPVFSKLLNENDLITSIDGASFYPSIYSPSKPKDWPHIDQTVSSDFMCYQSQFVASDTTASFVCTPKSHLSHQLILQKFNITSKDNWYKFTDDDIITLKSMFKKNYQIPIQSKKGSVIFWDSRTIHSAKYPSKNENSWRAVFYISMRPKNTYTKKDLRIIKKAVISGKTTNHWASKIFLPYDRFKVKNEAVTILTTNSETLSYYNQMSALSLQLSGL